MGVNYNPKIVTDGLVLALDAANSKSYPGTGTTWTDLSGNGNNGTLLNGVGYSDSNGGTLSFDGTNDYVDFNNILNMGTNSITISLWIKPLSIADSNDWLVSKARAAGQNFRYAFGIENGTNVPRIFFCALAGVDIIAKGSTPLSINSWHMLTGIWNRSASMKIYLNDKEQILSGNSDISQYSSSNFQSINPYRIGSYTALDNVSLFNPFNGNISHFFHYNRVLTELEIKQNFNATRSRYGI